MNKLFSFIGKLPSFITTTGAGVVIGNAVLGYASGQMPGREALYQGAVGVIGLGLRKAIFKGQVQNAGSGQ